MEMHAKCESNISLAFVQLSWSKMISQHGASNEKGKKKKVQPVKELILEKKAD